MALTQPIDVRDDIETRLKKGDFRGALVVAETEWCSKPSASLAAFIKNQFLPTLSSALPQKRVHFSRCFTIEPILPFLWVECLFSGFIAEFSLSEYNTVIQDLSSFQFGGDAENPDLVFAALHPRSFMPSVWNGDVSDAREALDWSISAIAGAVHKFRSETHISLVIQSFEIPYPVTTGVALVEPGRSREAILSAANSKIASLSEETSGCLFVDTNQVIADVGYRNWIDKRVWEISKCPYSATALPPLAKQWAAAIRASLLPPLKVLVVDLDNTLWGGVIGDDGPDALVVDADTSAGSGHLALQHTLKILKDRGTLLAIASKNDASTVEEGFGRIPNLAVSLEDFAVHKISWQSKVESIRAIAAELDVGIDAVAFLDDNPVEREEVAQGLPSVRVLPFLGAEHAAQYLLRMPQFQKAAIALEDRNRTELYRAEQARDAAFDGAGNRTEFLESLQQKIAVLPLSPLVLKRVADLEKKTNQFNLTTYRLGEAELAAMADAPGCAVLAFSVKDRFGDTGIIGSAAIKCRNEVAEVHSFLMSCRVIEREVEAAMLALAAQCALKFGAKRILGIHRPTKRNGIAAHFYEKMGFTKLDVAEDQTRWESECGLVAQLMPSVITVET